MEQIYKLNSNKASTGQINTVCQIYKKKMIERRKAGLIYLFIDKDKFKRVNKLLNSPQTYIAFMFPSLTTYKT